MPERDQQPGERCRSCAPTQAGLRSRAARRRRRRASSRGTSRTRIFANSVSISASAAQSAMITSGSSDELPPRVGGVGQEDRRGERRARASGVLQRPTAGRRGRGPRTRAAAPRGSSSARGACRGCRPAGGRSRRPPRARTRPRPARAPGSTRHCVPAVRGDDAAQVGRAGDQRRDRERRARASPRRTPRSHQVAAGAHQREAVADVPRRGGHRKTRQREQPGERERVMPDPQVAAHAAATGTSSTAATRLAATTAGASR